MGLVRVLRGGRCGQTPLSWFRRPPPGSRVRKSTRRRVRARAHTPQRDAAGEGRGGRIIGRNDSLGKRFSRRSKRRWRGEGGLSRTSERRVAQFAGGSAGPGSPDPLFTALPRGGCLSSREAVPVLGRRSHYLRHFRGGPGRGRPGSPADRENASLWQNEASLSR